MNHNYDEMTNNEILEVLGLDSNDDGTDEVICPTCGAEVKVNDYDTFCEHFIGAWAAYHDAADTLEEEACGASFASVHDFGDGGPCIVFWSLPEDNDDDAENDEPDTTMFNLAVSLAAFITFVMTMAALL